MAELKRVLGFWTILSLAISSIMGTGLFFGVAIGSAQSGNASILAWVILSFVALYISMYFSELSSMYPSAGGIYEFSKHAYNRFFSFMMGWVAWIVGNLSTALLVVAAMNYLIPDPSQFWLKIIISIVFIVVLNLIAFFGIEFGALLLVVFAFVAISVLLSVILPGAFKIDFDNYHPFFNYGFAPVFVAMFFLFESFFGWESATYLAEETKEPQRVIPKAIILGTIIVGILGIATAAVSLGVIPWRVLALSDTPLSIVSEQSIGHFGVKLLNIGIFAALIGSAAGGIITMPRLILALARDRLFIAQLSHVHERFKTPYKAIIFQSVVSLLIFAMAFGRYEALLSLLLPLGILMYLFIIIAVPMLRIKEPNTKRGFRVPFLGIGS